MKIQTVCFIMPQTLRGDTQANITWDGYLHNIHESKSTARAHQSHQTDDPAWPRSTDQLKARERRGDLGERCQPQTRAPRVDNTPGAESNSPRDRTKRTARQN